MPLCLKYLPILYKYTVCYGWEAVSLASLKYSATSSEANRLSDYCQLNRRQIAGGAETPPPLLVREPNGSAAAGGE